MNYRFYVRWPLRQRIVRLEEELVRVGIIQISTEEVKIRLHNQLPRITSLKVYVNA